MLMLLALGLTGCGNSGPKPLPAGPIDIRIKAISEYVTEVNEVVKGEVLMITFFKPSILDGKNWTWNYLETSMKVLSRMAEASQGAAYKRVAFMAQIPTRNNLGQEGRQLAMKVTYSLEKMDGAKWGNMTPFDVAELADDIEFRRLGTDAVIEYCKDGDHFQYTPTFCKRAVGSAMRQFNYP